MIVEGVIWIFISKVIKCFLIWDKVVILFAYTFVDLDRSTCCGDSYHTMLNVFLEVPDEDLSLVIRRILEIDEL